MKTEKLQEMAAKMTAESASVKEWRLNSIRDRKLKVLADEWMKQGGYIVAKDSEVKKMFPELCRFSVVENPLRVWGVYTDVTSRHGRRKLDIVAVGNIEE